MGLQMDRRLLIALCLLVCSTIPSQGMNTYYLNEWCNKEFQIDDAARLLSSQFTSLPPNSNCSLVVKATVDIIGGNPYVLARFLKFDVGTSTTCATNRLELLDGLREPSPITGPNGLCGTTLSTYTYSTNNDSFMQINLITGSTQLNGGFDIILTSFHEAPCLNQEWMCQNRRCINSDLRCDGFDNCGDNSDEQYERCQPEVYLDENCGLPINVYDSVKLKLTRDSLKIKQSLDCTVDITALDYVIGGQPRVQAHFRSINLPPPTNGNCSQARIDLYDGIREPKQLTGSEGICGTNLPQDYATTDDRFMTLKFKTDPTENLGGVDILLSMYHESPCFTGEWMCSNGKCIMDYLRCDGNNNCGDNSDEADTLCKSQSKSKGLSGGVIAVIVILVLIVVGVTGGFAFKFFYSKRWEYKQVQ